MTTSTPGFQPDHSGFFQSIANAIPAYRDEQKDLAGIANTQAQTRDMSAQAAQRELDVSNQKQQAQILQQMAQKRTQAIGQAAQSIQQLNDQGMALIGGGQPVAGAKLIEQAALIQSHLATAKREQDTQQNQQFEQHEKILADQARVWAGINTPEDLHDAAIQWTHDHPQQENPFSGKAYNKDQVELYRRTTTAGLAYVKEQRAAEKDKEALKFKESADKFREARQQLEEKKFELRKEQSARAKKTGGVVAAPNAKLLEQALERISDKYPTLAAREGDTASYEVASRAMELVKANPGVGMAQALDQSMEESEKNQDFKSVEANYKLFGIDIPFASKTETRYRPKEVKSDDSPKPADKPSEMKIQVGKPNVNWKGTDQSKALSYLNDHPEMADQFREKYGFLPEGEFADEDLK